MIREIKKRYVLGVAVSALFLLVLIILTININNSKSVRDRSDKGIDLIAQYYGFLPTDEEVDAPEAKYFFVSIRNGEAVDVKIQNLADITQDEAIEMATQLNSRWQKSGFTDYFKYRAISDGDTTHYIFLDVSYEITAFQSFFSSSVKMSLISMTIIVSLLILFSNMLLKPIIESYEKQRRFITDAGHELKTPLAIIEANTDVLEMIHGEDEWTDSIKNQTKRLAALTANLVYLSKMEENPDVKKKETFSFTDVTREVCDSWHTVADAKGKSFTFSVDQGILLKGSRGDISKLLSILFDNAVKYTNEGGSIHTTLTRTQNGTELSVKNTVDSIEEGNLNVLFDRFFRLDSSRNSSTGGFGVGLSLAKSIVMKHKGKISAKSEDGKSLTITATFPPTWQHYRYEALR